MMEIRVKLTGTGDLDTAIERVQAARQELEAATLQLDRACCKIGLEFEEIDKTASVASTDGLDTTP